MSLIEYPAIDQGTEEWHAVRRGMVTASVVGQLITVGSADALSVDCPTCNATAGDQCLSMARRKEPVTIKTAHDDRSARAATQPPVYSVASNDTSRALTALLVAERVSGYTEPTFTTADMWRGRDSEPLARDLYAEFYGRPVREVGFMVNDDHGFEIGYSPDGLVGDDGLIEVKAPRARGHVLTVIDNEVPARHMAQLQCGLLVTGRKWIDFISYSGGLPMWPKRVTPDPRWFEAIIAAVEAFERNAVAMVATYRTNTQGLPATERMPDFEDVELKLA